MTRYPGFDALANWHTPDWDDSTRALVRERVESVPPFRFFAPEQVRLLEAVLDRIVPQHGARHQRVPVAQRIDAKLFDDLRDGYRYEEMPPQREAWLLGLAAIDATARALYGSGFEAVPVDAQDAVLERVQQGDPPGEPWRQLPARRFFADVLCPTAIAMYYCDPAAWSEIGYSGPAAIRGHVRKWTAGVDPWEPRESLDVQE